MSKIKTMFNEELIVFMIKWTLIVYAVLDIVI